jgi:pimeloyl-ACP methyl ester carboxylesterase
MFLVPIGDHRRIGCPVLVIWGEFGKMHSLVEN